MKLLRLAVVAAALATLLGVPAHATLCTETASDAGQLTGTAQPCGAGVTSIVGVLGIPTVSGLVGGSDVDMFELVLVGGQLFTATTVGLAAFDSTLFLFDSSGRGLAMNDDVSPDARSTLNFLPSSSGSYFLAISQFPINPESAGGRIFPLTNPDTGDFTGTWGPSGPGGLGMVTDWPDSGIADFCDTDGDEEADGPCPIDPYTINITGAGAPVVPEPGTLVLLGTGLLGLSAFRRRPR